MPTLFYYPKINAPRFVVHQALLYWDRLVTVAPPGELEKFLDDRMRQVHDAGLYRGWQADRWPDYDLERALRLVAHLAGRVPADELIPDDGPDSYMYRSKLSSEIIEDLERRGLARTGDGFGIRISAATQLCLISAAARDIAARYQHLGGGQAFVTG